MKENAGLTYSGLNDAIFQQSIRVVLAVDIKTVLAPVPDPVPCISRKGLLARGRPALSSQR
jgi:hypothetical protein